MQLEATGKSVEIAIQNGLLECGMKREEVEVKVLEQGGLFKKAKVLLVWGEEIAKDEQPKQEETVISTEQQVEETSEEVIPEVKEEKKKRVYDTTRIQEKGKEFLLGLANLVGDRKSVV